MAWNNDQMKSVAKNWLKRYGPAMEFLRGDMREDCVRSYVLSVVTGQDAETVKLDDIRDLCIGVVQAIKLKTSHYYFD
jgi:hypothetical protein